MNPLANAGDAGSTPGQEDPLEEEMATHSNIVAWEILWTEEPAGNSSWGHREWDTTQQLNNKNKKVSFTTSLNFSILDSENYE